MTHFEFAIFGDRMMQGDHSRDQFFEFGNAVAETLIVVHDVKLAHPRSQMP